MRQTELAWPPLTSLPATGPSASMLRSCAQSSTKAFRSDDSAAAWALLRRFHHLSRSRAEQPALYLEPSNFPPSQREATLIRELFVLDQYRRLPLRPCETFQ